MTFEHTTVALITLAALLLIVVGTVGGLWVFAFAVGAALLVNTATERVGDKEKMRLLKKLNEARRDLTDEARPFAFDRTEAVCVRRCLDDQNVPTEKDGESLSLWGRVTLFAGKYDEMQRR